MEQHKACTLPLPGVQRDKGISQHKEKQGPKQKQNPQQKNKACNNEIKQTVKKPGRSSHIRLYPYTVAVQLATHKTNSSPLRIM
jgi:hypothetical protein